jgi:TolB-like protein/Tfp pilus assembly protein PilF
LATVRVERRLAAILAADVAGYSRLMNADEEGTHQRFKEHLRELVDPKINEHRGRIVKNTGDGLLAEFPSAVNAVRCAAEVQRAMVDRNAGISEDKRISFRIGVNLGDVIVEPEDIFGDGVNIAARLEALAEPGGLCISRTVYDQVAERTPYPFEDIGEQTVKNIPRPVRAYRISAAAVASLPQTPTRAEAREPASLSTVPSLSIVVLPFVNLSNDPEQEYFADGITEDLTTDLSRISGSFVIARNTAFTYKGKPADVKEIGRELGVRYVLEGSIRRAGDQVRVNVQLIDAATGAHLWAERFDCDFAMLADAQDAITGRIAQSLDLELIQHVDRRMAQEATPNPGALDFVLRGRAWLHRPRSAASRIEAQRAFEQALELDTGAVDARIALAVALLSNVLDGWSLSPQQDQERAGRLLREALGDDTNRPMAHLAKGLLCRLQNRLAEARIEFETAVSLDRNFANAYRHLGITLMHLGEPDVAIPSIEKAIRLNPRDPNVAGHYWALGAGHLLLGRTDHALDLLRRARAGNPRYWYVHLWLASALGLKGDLEEARTALAEAIKLKPEVNSLARYRAEVPFGNVRYWALREKTVDIGLRRTGMPDE